jgi:serine/threonine protein kinase
MEFVPGKPLDLEIKTRLEAGSADSVNRDLPRWLRAILEFLVTLESEGLFYTDFKPANLRVTPSGDLRLLDAGSIVGVDGSRLTPTTPGYGPEEISDAPTARELEVISLISLGRTLYACLLNKVLYHGAPHDPRAIEPIWGARWMEFIGELSSGSITTLSAARGAVPCEPTREASRS